VNVKADARGEMMGAETERRLRIAGLTVLAAAAAGAVATLIVRDQMTRHRKDLFSPNALRRLAALGYLARSEPAVESVMLLRDFLSWEPRRLLRGRARSILRRMEDDARRDEVVLRSAG